MKKPIDVSIIVLSYNTERLTKACIESVLRQRNVLMEVLVIDNASGDGSAQMLQKMKKQNKNIQLILSKKNVGFGGGNNMGMKRAKGRYLLLLNSDTEMEDQTCSNMVSWMDKHPEVGVSTCQLKNPDGSIQATGGKFPTLARLFAWAVFIDDIPLFGDLFGSYHPHTPRSFAGGAYYQKQHEQDWITGAFMLIRREAYARVGGFDTRFFMYTEDVEYCYRFRENGWRVWYVPHVSIMHVGGASSEGNAITFSDGVGGKEKSIVGEFMGVKIFYEKHKPHYLPHAILLLKIAAGVRFIVFGYILGQVHARNIYRSAFRTV